MILDNLLLFSSAQNLTTGTIASTNVIDLNNARDIGIGDDPSLEVAIFITTAMASTDSCTLVIQFQGSTDNSTFTTYAESRAYTAGELTLGRKMFPITVPAKDDAVSLPRYLRLAYVMGALHFTPGALSAAIVLDRQDQIPGGYPAGITVAN